jgi:hypothetical protein
MTRWLTTWRESSSPSPTSFTARNSSSSEPKTFLCLSKYTEMEHLNGIFCPGFQTRVFVWFSTLSFSFYKMLFMDRLEFFSCFFLFRGYFCKDLKNQRRVPVCFFYNPPVEGTVNSMEQKTSESFVKLMSKNSICVVIDGFF